jgi:hypothetical protein
MRARFPTGTHWCRSPMRDILLQGEENVLTMREKPLPQNSELSLEAIFCASSFVNSNKWHLICNNSYLNFIYGCILICVVFTYSRFIENPPI